MDGSPPGSPVPGILQAKTLEWVAISFSNAWKWKVKVKSLSRVRLPATPWTAAHQAPPSMGFSRQEYWSGMPLHLFKNLIHLQHHHTSSFFLFQLAYNLTWHVSLLQLRLFLFYQIHIWLVIYSNTSFYIYQCLWFFILLYFFHRMARKRRRQGVMD